MLISIVLMSNDNEYCHNTIKKRKLTHNSQPSLVLSYNILSEIKTQKLD